MDKIRKCTKAAGIIWWCDKCNGNQYITNDRYSVNNAG